MSSPSLFRNVSGYMRAHTEEELYRFLEQEYLPEKFGKQWQHRYIFDFGCEIDYYYKEPLPTLIEVKNWFVRIKDMQQIMKYLVHATEKFGANGFRFVLIAGGIDKERKTLLEALGVEIILTKNIFSN